MPIPSRLAIQVCVNGARSREAHPALSDDPVVMASEAARAAAFGAGSIHVHPKGQAGADSLAPEDVDRWVTAFRAACPGIPLGVTTGAWILPDPADRIRAIEGWSALPDVASVNWHEDGAEDVAAALLGRGIGIEAGLWHADAAALWSRSPHRGACLRALLEVPSSPEGGVEAAAQRLVDVVRRAEPDLPILLHGEEASTWPALELALAWSLDTRIGLEDTLRGVHGEVASGNAELVREAVALRSRTGDAREAGAAASGTSPHPRGALPRAALITGVGRRRGIGAAIAQGLAAEGFDLALSHSDDYDRRVNGEPSDVEKLAEELRATGRRVELVEGDLADPAVPQRLVAAAAEAIGPLGALVMCHCESVDSSILDTTVESFDRHYAVNVRASWLLLRSFAERVPVGGPGGAAIALTSDHTAHNLPYGATKGALDRVVLAGTHELADRGIRTNVINPGPIDTGWMTDAVRAECAAQTPGGALGSPDTVADLVRFLVSERGTWIRGQLLLSNGGFATPAV